MRTVRHLAARILLAVFVTTAQVAPVAHLATHRPDHTHAPDLRGDQDADRHDAQAAGLPHEHDDDGADHDHDADHENAPSVPSHRHDDPAGGDHGRDSVSHFGVALLQAPPPPVVPAPAEALAAPPDTRLSWLATPALPQPPSRGPPVRPS